MITLICLICKKEFQVKPYRTKTAKFCSRKCYGIAQQGKSILPQQGFQKRNQYGKRLKGQNHGRWKGYKRKNNGYILVHCPYHPRAVASRVYEHQLIAEKYLGRYLIKTERVHHINEIRNDNRPENLYLFPNEAKHRLFHHSKNKPKLISNIFQSV